MKVLVTGATGFIGGNLARALCQSGYEVRTLVRPGSNTLTIDDTGAEQVQGDILDRESVLRAARGCQAVFHCAAAYAFWARDPRTIYQTNVTGTAIVLEAAQEAGVSRVVYTSTVSTVGLPRRDPAGSLSLGEIPSFGSAQDRPKPPLQKGRGRMRSRSGPAEPGVGDHQAALGTEDTAIDPRHLVGNYKKSKYQAEQLALKRCADGLPVVVVNPTTPVGPWDIKPTPTGKMVLDFVRGRIPVYVDTGMNLVDVADVVMGHILALEKGQPGERYLLGNRNISLVELFTMLQELAGRRAPRWRAPFWLAIGAGYIDLLLEGGLLRREPRIPLEGLKVSKTPMYVSCQKAITELGLPQSPVEAALEKAVRWFKDYGYA